MMMKEYKKAGRYVVIGLNQEQEPYVLLITFPSVEERVQARMREPDGSDEERALTTHERVLGHALKWFNEQKIDVQMKEPIVVPLEKFQHIAPALNELITSSTEV